MYNFLKFIRDLLLCSRENKLSVEFILFHFILRDFLSSYPFTLQTFWYSVDGSEVSFRIERKTMDA